jgi:hypothetical protein
LGEINVQDLDSHADSIHEAVQNLHAKLNSLPENLRNLLTGKVKFHLLYHLAECVKRFGPPPLTCTEKEESFNQSTRLVISNSNRHAYSSHTGMTFSECQNLKFILLGAYFCINGNWCTASKRVLRYGSYLLRESVKTKENIPRIYGESVFARSGYSAHKDGFVEFFEEDKNTCNVFRIVSITSDPPLLIARPCTLVGYDMFKNDVYEVKNDEETRTFSQNQLHNVNFVLNMQHLCDSNCKFVDAQKKVEEVLVRCKKMVHSTRSFYARNNFCFSH